MEAVVVSTEEVAVFTAAVLLVDFTGEASAVALSTAALVSVGDISSVAVSTALAFVMAVSVGGTGVETGAVTVSLIMSSSAATAIRGGAGTIHTDIMVTTITHTITMDTAGPVTTGAAVTDTAMAVDQGISGVCGVGDMPRLRLFEIARLLVPVDNDADYVDPSDIYEDRTKHIALVLHRIVPPGLQRDFSADRTTSRSEHRFGARCLGRWFRLERRLRYSG